LKTNNKQKNSYDYDEDEAKTEKYSYIPQNISNNNNNSETTDIENFHFKYQTYREECSKLMANDAYDPNSIHEKADGFDLRNFLREKAFKHQHDNNNNNNNKSESTTATNSASSNNSGDIIYEQPITKPIDIKNELFYHNKLKGKNYYDYFNNSNYRRKFQQNDKYQFSNKFNRNNRNEDSIQETTQQIEKNSSSSSDESEDDLTNCKKLRSVVAVVSNK
jgi:hypothetical protein